MTDVRLGLGYLAFAISAATFYWDYKLGFESTKYYTAAAVALYACINGVLTIWIWGVEKGKIYVGTSPNGEKARFPQAGVVRSIYILGFTSNITSDLDIDSYEKARSHLQYYYNLHYCVQYQAPANHHAL